MKDVHAWVLEISAWLKLYWFKNIVKGAGLEVKERRLAQEQEASNTQQPKVNSYLVRFPTYPNPSTQLTENIRKGNVTLRSPPLARYIIPGLSDSP
jgi:hypothetical protein